MCVPNGSIPVTLAQYDAEHEEPKTVIAPFILNLSRQLLATLLTLAPIGLCATTARADQSPTSQEDGSVASIEKTAKIEGITEYRLENGVRVLLFPDDSKQVVTVNMTVFVGSRHEGYGEAGMAHLLEHMLFKGTPTTPDVPKALKDRGAGNSMNGTTWLDRTNYYETLPASPDNLDFAISLEADRLVNSFIRGEDLQSEMTVVRNEFERGENSPVRVLMQRIQSAAYQWHNYGKSTIGNRSDIERVPIVNLRKFYKRFYRPDNVLLIIAGNFETDFALGSVQKHFGALRRPDSPIDPTYTTEPAQDGERTVVVRRVADVQWAGAAYHIPAGSHPDYAAASALVSILSDVPSGRLYKGLVESEYATSVFSTAYALAEPGLFLSMAEVPVDKSIESARAQLVRLMEESFAEHPVTQAELDRAVQQLLKRRELEAADVQRLAISLSDWAAQGDWRLYFLFRDSLEALTPDQVQAVAEKYFVRNNRTVGLFIPSEASDRISIPEPPDISSLVENYQGRAEMSRGETFDPTPTAIEQRTIRGTLIDGMEYALLPKKTRGETIALRMTIRFGTADTMLDKIAAIELVGALMARGTEKLDYVALQDELTRLRTDLSVNSTVGLISFNVKTKREYLPEAIDLLGDVMRSPQLDRDELNVIRRQVLTNLQKSLSEPNSLGPRSVSRSLSPYGKNDVRYVPTIEEEINRYTDVTIEQVRAVYRSMFSTQDGEIAAVGDFDPDELLGLLKSELAGWKSETDYVRVDRPPHPNIRGVLNVVETPDKANALYYASQQYALADDSPEYAALKLGNFILGGGSLSSRLGNRVRQQEGLSYGVGSGLANRTLDDRVDFTIYAITNPDNKDKLIGVIHEELDRIRVQGITRSELDEAKQAYLQAERVRRASDASLAGELLGTVVADRTMAYHERHERQIEELTVEDVNAAIAKYIQPDQLVEAVAGDFAAGS